jgi:hypothetical protein
MRSVGRMVTLVAAIAAITLRAGPAPACSGFDSVISVPYSELIGLADRIVLATLVDAVSVEPDIPEQPEPLSVDKMLKLVEKGQSTHMYRFSVKGTLKGESKEHVTIEIVGRSHQSESSDFDEHTDYRFWLDNGGRLGVEADCSLRPGFEKGQDYLLILANERHRKSFELILSPNDAWLKEVRRVLAVSRLASENHALLRE